MTVGFAKSMVAVSLLAVATIWPIGAGSLASATPYELDAGANWVVVASLQDSADAVAVAIQYADHQSWVFRSANGLYSVVLGPYQTTDMAAFRQGFTGPPLPSDAYLSKGARWVEEIWRTGQSSAEGSSGPDVGTSGSYEQPPGNAHWVVIASRQVSNDAVAIAQQYLDYHPWVFRSVNGWYAVALGPYETLDIASLRESVLGPALPSDAYLSKGGRFVEAVWWPQGAADSQSTSK